MPRPAAAVTDLWRRYGWLLLGLLWALALALAYSGFGAHAAAAGRPVSTLDRLYLTLQLVSMNSGAVDPPVPWQLQVGRFLIPLLAAWTAARALLGLFQDRWRQYLVRATWRDHVVICGLSRKGWLLTRGFVEQGYRVAVIESDEDNDLVIAGREIGATVLIGDATSFEMLQQAAAPRARHLIAVTDDDGVNAEIAVRVQALLRDVSRSYPLTCTVHLVDPQLYELARAREMSLEQTVPLRLELFNVYDRGARMLWNQYGAGQAASPAQVAPAGHSTAHMAVIGLGRLGESLVVYAARDWYARLHATPPTSGGRVRITVIDRDADWKCRALAARYPQLTQACDLVALAVNVRWPDFLDGAFLAGGTDYPPAGVVYVCFDDDSLGLRTGLDVFHRQRQLAGKPIPIIVRMAESGGLARLLGPDDDTPGAFTGLRAFGLLDNTCTPAVILGGTYAMLARGLHEGYVRRQQAVGETAATNPALLPWEDLPDEMRQSNLAEADAIARHLHSLGYDPVPLTRWDVAAFAFSQEEVERLARLEHERFLAERAGSGWRYAPEPKDTPGKTSPALLPWEDLPEIERAKTRATVEELPATLAQAGFEIVRRGDLEVDAAV